MFEARDSLSGIVAQFAFLAVATACVATVVLWPVHSFGALAVAPFIASGSVLAFTALTAWQRSAK